MARDKIALEDLKSAVQEAPSTKAAEIKEANEPVVPKIDAQGRSYATGKRKNAIARVWIKPGKGQIVVNGRGSSQYFARPVLQMLIAQPMEAANR